MDTHLICVFSNQNSFTFQFNDPTCSFEIFLIFLLVIDLLVEHISHTPQTDTWIYYKFRMLAITYMLAVSHVVYDGGFTLTLNIYVISSLRYILLTCILFHITKFSLYILLSIADIDIMHDTFHCFWNYVCCVNVLHERMCYETRFLRCFFNSLFCWLSGMSSFVVGVTWNALLCAKVSHEMGS